MQKATEYSLYHAKDMLNGNESCQALPEEYLFHLPLTYDTCIHRDPRQILSYQAHNEVHTYHTLYCTLDCDYQGSTH